MYVSPNLWIFTLEIRSLKNMNIHSDAFIYYQSFEINIFFNVTSLKCRPDLKHANEQIG